MKVDLTEYGALTVFTEDLTFVGTSFNLRLTINAERFAGESSSQDLDFEVHLIGCTSVGSSSSTSYDEVTYTLGDPLISV